jgi:hypothetical protein
MVQPLLSDPSLLLLSCNAKKRDVLLNWLGPAGGARVSHGFCCQVQVELLAGNIEQVQVLHIIAAGQTRNLLEMPARPMPISWELSVKRSWKPHPRLTL